MSGQARRRRRAYKRGIWAEYIAGLYLMIRGYKPIKFRYKSPVGEIDILAQKNNTLVAVEVKMRRRRSEALESVNSKTRHRITRAVEHFVAFHPAFAGHDIRFDVVALTAGRFFPFAVFHLDNAWQVRS